jgi:hypothetical protein
MARPVRKWFVSSRLSNLRKRIRPFGCAVGQDGDPRILILIKGPASSAIFRQGFQNADRLSGHLPLNHTQTLILIKGPASSAIFRQGFQNADRLSGHLPLNHTQTSAIAARARRPIGSQARIAAAS